MKLRFATVLSLIFFAITIFSAAASAQTSKGTLTGTVTDPSGSSVANATVTARGLQNGETRTVTTGNYGEYRITAMLPGTYEVKASLKASPTW